MECAMRLSALIVAVLVHVAANGEEPMGAGAYADVPEQYRAICVKMWADEIGRLERDLAETKEEIKDPIRIDKLKKANGTRFPDSKVSLADLRDRQKLLEGLLIPLKRNNPPYVPVLPSSPLRIKTWGHYNYNAKVIQIINEDTAIFEFGNVSRGGNGWVCVSGFSTADLVDDVRVRLSTPMIYIDTYSYTTVLGAKKTIPHMKALRFPRDPDAPSLRGGDSANWIETDKPKSEGSRQRPIAEATWRTWTTANGKFRVDAKLLSIGRGNAKLEKRDGTTVEVKPDILSPEDQDFIEQWKRTRR